MLVSRTSMNAAMATTTAISQGLYLGRQTSCSSVSAAELIKRKSCSESYLTNGLGKDGSEPCRPASRVHPENIENPAPKGRTALAQRFSAGKTGLIADTRPAPRSCLVEAADLCSPPDRERSSPESFGQFSRNFP